MVNNDTMIQQCSNRTNFYMKLKKHTALEDGTCRLDLKHKAVIFANYTEINTISHSNGTHVDIL